MSAPLKTITRLKPCDLQAIQIQANVTVNGTIANVIAALQSNRSTVPVPLNTNCPTCKVDDVSQGYISATIGGVTAKTVCHTCFGYLLYNTSRGSVTPPTNPFNAPIVAGRILPADLQEALNWFSRSTTLETMIVSLQENFTIPVTNNCPKCSHTGWITVQSVKTPCYVCSGLQKTAYLMVMDGNKAVMSPVVEPMPDPLPSIPIPS